MGSPLLVSVLEAESNTPRTDASLLFEAVRSSLATGGRLAAR